MSNQEQEQVRYESEVYVPGEETVPYRSWVRLQKGEIDGMVVVTCTEYLSGQSPLAMRFLSKHDWEEICECFPEMEPLELAKLLEDAGANHRWFRLDMRVCRILDGTPVISEVEDGIHGWEACTDALYLAGVPYAVVELGM